jgi:hypothetical protein
MENLDRMVAETLAENGFETPVYLRPIQWSRWFRCESSFSLLLVPSAPGLYALAEEVAAPGETPTGKRMLAVFEIAETDDLCVALSRQFAPHSPLSQRLSSGHCFVRFAQLRDVERRRAICNSLNRWLAASAQAAAGLASEGTASDSRIARDFTGSDSTARDGAPQVAAAHAGSTPPIAAKSSETAPVAHQTELDTAALGDEPPPLPSGF